MFFSGEKMDSYETLYLHMFRLTGPSNIDPVPASSDAVLLANLKKYLEKLKTIIKNKGKILQSQFYKTGKL